LSRKKLFLTNILVYGFSGVIGKIIPIIMLPIIAKLIPDPSVYGVSDVLQVLATFGATIAGMGMYDAVFRLYFDREDQIYRKNICSTALGVVLSSGIVVCALIIILRKPISNIFFGTDEYAFWVLLSAIHVLLSAIGTVIKAPTRIQNKRKVYFFINLLNPVVNYSVSIPIILFIDPLLGLVFGTFSTSVVDLVIFWFLNKNWFNEKKSIEIAKSLAKFGIPLIPNILVLWIFHSFDRIMISKIMGPSFAGIYAVGAKIAQMSQLIYIAYSGGWQYFAFSTMRDKDYKQMMSKIWRLLAAAIFSFWALITPFSRIIFELFFEGDYINGYQVFPYLLLSPLLLMLYTVITTQFHVMKKTIWSTFILTIGSITNIILNFMLIPVLGIKGAGISTMLGYCVSVMIAGIIIAKYRRMDFRKATIWNILLFSIFVFFSMLNENGGFRNCCISAIFLVLTFLIHKKEILELITKVLRKETIVREKEGG